MNELTLRITMITEVDPDKGGWGVKRELEVK